MTLYEIFKRLSNTLWSTVSKAADMSNRTIMCCLLFFLTIICLFIFESGILGRVISLAKLVFDNNQSEAIVTASSKICSQSLGLCVTGAVIPFVEKLKLLGLHLITI